MGGHVIGLLPTTLRWRQGKSIAPRKNARFIRFCNLYNIPVMFLEDTTGFLPEEQEHRGIVQAGRAMLDAIVDLRTPRFLVLVSVFCGAYASYNNYYRCGFRRGAADNAGGRNGSGGR